MSVEQTRTPEIVNHRHQVIIVGSGPVGSVAAAKLAEGGIDVIMLDYQSFPRDKTCGDGVPNGAVKFISEIPGAIDKIKDMNFHTIDQILIGSPNGRELNAPLGGENYVIPRITLDNWLKELATDLGVKTLTAKVKNLIFNENNQVIGVYAEEKDGTNHNIFTQVVVGADGATSTIGRELGLSKHPDNQSAVATRGYITGTNIEHTTGFWILDEILPGYAWLFALGEGNANIGVGMRTDEYKNGKHDLKNMLDIFIDILKQKGHLEPNYELSRIAQWPLPMAMKLHDHKLAFNGAVLVGDAGRLINGLSGGGISSGVESACIAAQTITKLVQKTTAPLTLRQLSEYETTVKAKLGRTMQIATIVANLIVKYPEITNFATSIENPIIRKQIVGLLSNL